VYDLECELRAKNQRSIASRASFGNVSGWGKAEQNLLKPEKGAEKGPFFGPLFFRVFNWPKQKLSISRYQTFQLADTKSYNQPYD
jgi:hypothetical protein